MARTRETIGEVVLKGALNQDAVLVTQRDQNLNVKECSGTSTPSAKAGYAMGCDYVNTTTGAHYKNTGSITSCTFTIQTTDWPSPVVRWWVPTDGTLQALITSITDATSNKVYDIMIPPGQGGAYDVTGALVLKPFVNLKAAGGKDIKTVMSYTGGISIASAGLLSGNNRLTIEGIRFNDTVTTLENITGSNTLTVYIKDCYMPATSYVRVCGASYALRAKTNVHFIDSWHQNNTQAQSSFIYCKLYVWGGEFHMLNYVDSDIFFENTRLKSDQMADVTSANYKTQAAGTGMSCSVIYHNCGEERYTPQTGVSLYHHVMANWAGNTNTCQVNGIIKGTGVPAGDVGLEGSLDYELGTTYIDSATGKLHIKTAASATDTWAVVGAQTT